MRIFVAFPGGIMSPTSQYGFSLRMFVFLILISVTVTRMLINTPEHLRYECAIHLCRYAFNPIARYSIWFPTSAHYRGTTALARPTILVLTGLNFACITNSQPIATVNQAIQTRNMQSSLSIDIDSKLDLTDVV